MRRADYIARMPCFDLYGHDTALDTIRRCVLAVRDVLDRYRSVRQFQCATAAICPLHSHSLSIRMKLEDFDYELPRELIAQLPLSERSASRLLHLDGTSGALADRSFTDIVELIAPEDLLILNDTRVIKARLQGRKKSGGKVELLVERVLASNEALVQIRASHSPREGAT